MRERICQRCQRVLQESVHDKCMFCGEPIPEIFKLSEIKKEEIREKAEEREKKRKARKKSGDGYGGGGSGACGAACGSCGAG